MDVGLQSSLSCALRAFHMLREEKYNEPSPMPRSGTKKTVHTHGIASDVQTAPGPS